MQGQTNCRDVVEAHCYVVNIRWNHCKQIRSRINNNWCRTFQPRRPLSTAYKTFCTQLTKAYVAKTSQWQTRECWQKLSIAWFLKHLLLLILVVFLWFQFERASANTFAAISDSDKDSQNDLVAKLHDTAVIYDDIMADNRDDQRSVHSNLHSN